MSSPRWFGGKLYRLGVELASEPACSPGVASSGACRLSPTLVRACGWSVRGGALGAGGAGKCCDGLRTLTRWPRLISARWINGEGQMVRATAWRIRDLRKAPGLPAKGAKSTQCGVPLRKSPHFAPFTSGSSFRVTVETNTIGTASIAHYVRVFDVMGMRD